MIYSSSCTDRTRLSEEELVQWFEDKSKGAIVEVETDNLIIRSMYQSPDYIVGKEFLNGVTSSEQEAERYKGLTSNALFKISIGYKNGGSLLRGSEKETKETYIRSKIKSDFELTINNAVYKPTLIHLERDYGLKPMTDFLVGFSGVPDDFNELQLNYKNKLVDTTTLLFEYDIDKMPQLKKL